MDAQFLLPLATYGWYGLSKKGFGKELLEAMIKWCKTFPFGESGTIYSSCDVASKKSHAFLSKMWFWTNRRLHRWRNSIKKTHRRGKIIYERKIWSS